MYNGLSSSGRSRLHPLKARCLASLLGLGLVSWSSLAAALGLGEIHLHSGLNQPFNADIDLIDTAGLGADDLRVSLASPEAFAKAGMDRSFFLTDLRFTAVFDRGSPFIHVESNKVVIEPFLSVLVQVDRPAGQVLRGYTLLIDPPGAVPLAPARIPSYGSRAAAAPVPAEPARANAVEAPAAPPQALPPASQGKRYVVEKGDTLWTIGKKLQAAGTPTPPNQLVRDIRALNPERAPLKVGQSLSLPDAAVLPEEAAPAAPPPPAPSDAPVAQAPAAPDMAASVLNQQLQQNLDALQAKVKGLETEVASKNDQLTTLQGQLAARPANPVPAPAPAPASAPASTAPAPVATPPAAVPAPAAPVVEDNSWMLQAAALAVLVLLLGLLAWRRRTQGAKAADVAPPPPVETAPVLPAAPATVNVAPPAIPTTPVETPMAMARKGAPATDALDGASIYIAYGRFNEALGILREGARREPERTDLRLRILEVLAQQGDVQAYAAEERALREQGTPARELERVRERYPKIALALAATAVATPVAGPVETQAALGELDEPELIADLPFEAPAVDGDPAALSVGPADDELLELDLSDLPDLDDLDTPVAASAPVDEFQLNLDDLSLDADWASVDPFDTPAKPRAAEAEAAAEGEGRAPVPDALGMGFTSNLSEFPEVLELPEAHYLDELGDELGATPVETVNEFDASALDEDAPLELPDLDDLPDLESLAVDFDALDSPPLTAGKLEQAQALLDQGEPDQASRLLYELLREGDEASRQTARALLARLEH